MSGSRKLVAMACDEEYLYPWAVSLVSLAQQSSRPFELWFGLTQDWPTRLRPESLERLQSLGASLGIGLRLVETPLSVKDLPSEMHISPTAFIKPALFDLCPADATMVWLDADTTVRGDMHDLVALAAGHAVSGVHEPNATFESSWPAGGSNWYVNTGVVVVDGFQWRELFQGTWMPLMSEYTKHQFKFLDQDVLNAVVRDRWNLLPETYNFRPSHAKVWGNPCIVHYAGWWKPWMRTKRQLRKIEGVWRVAFHEYINHETAFARHVKQNLSRAERDFWSLTHRRLRGAASWKAHLHYVKGVLGQV